MAALLSLLVRLSSPAAAPLSADSIPVIITDPTLSPDELYGDTLVTVSPGHEETNVTPAQFALDHTHRFDWKDYAIPAGVITASALFVKTPKLVQARHWVQQQLANRTGQPRTEVDNYLQYLPMVAGYGLYFCGVKGEHNLLDKTILLAMSYATFAALNHTMKFAFDEQRPNSMALNSFPSGHTGTVFVGAEFLRREYWHTNKFIAVGGYLCAAAVGYMRIYNNRHWFNDVLAGAALGYMSASFAYWLYPKIFRKRARRHSIELLQRIEPETAAAATPGSRTAGPGNPAWMATPFLSSSSAGVSCMVLF